MNKKWIYGAVAVFILAAVVAASGRQEVSKNKARVAVLMPFSEAFAWWGDAIRHSIETAQANGYARDFEFVYEDTKCNTKDAVSATQSLKARYPDIRLYMVGCDNDLQAMVPLLDPAQDLSFMVGLSGADLYASKFPIINLAYRLEAEGSRVAQFAIEKFGAKKFGIITDTGIFGGTLESSARGYMESAGGKAFSERLKFNDPNPETSVLKVLQGKPDAVYIQNDIPGITAILKRLDQMGYEGERIVYYGGRDQSLIDAAGEIADGVYVPWVISDISNRSREIFEESFRSAYGKDPFVTAYFVYDGLMLLGQADEACDGNIRCIEEYFYEKDDFSGTLGKVRYQPNGEVERTFYFQQIRNGEFIEAE